MKNKDVYNIIDKIMPFSSAAGFDNVGLLVGSENKEVSGIIICLDITNDVIEEAKEIGANLIVSHHPVIFDPLKSIDSNTVLYKLISYNMSAICCHTNFDMCDNIGVNSAFAEKLGIQIQKENDYYVCVLDEEIDSDILAKNFKEKFTESPMQYSNLQRKIKKIAMCSGSGSGAFNELKNDVDAFVTGELKYDLWLSARQKGIVVFAFGHHETEHICVPYMKKYLSENLNEVEINISSKEVNPIKYM